MCSDWVDGVGSRRARPGQTRSSFVEEFYTGTEDVRGVGAETAVVQRLDVLLADLVRKDRGGRMAGALSFAVTNFLYVVGYSLGWRLGRGYT